MRRDNMIRIGLPVVLLAVGGGVAAQQPSVEIRGVVFDSLRGRPVPGATVGVIGGGSTTSDSRGRFRVPGVPAGERTIVVQHAMFDTVGLSGLTRRVHVTDGRGEIVVAVPSFQTFWRVACGAEAPSGDQGLIYGSVRDADGAPVPGAEVHVSWVATSVVGQRDIRQQQWNGETQTDSAGSFGICGVPLTSALHLRAFAPGRGVTDIDVFPNDLRVARQDVVIGTSADAVGTVVGQLTDQTGAPFAGARVLLDTLDEVRSDDGGRFVIRNVPEGTQQLEVLSIGMMPAHATVNVQANDTVVVALQLNRVTTLAVVNVTASARARRIINDFEERRVKGMGYIRDSSEINGMGTMSGMFGGFPSLRVHTGRSPSQFILTLPGKFRGMGGGMDGRCIPGLWIDKIRERDFSRFITMRPDDIAAVEVYTRAFTTPAEFTYPGSDCGAVVVWTKYAFR